MQSLDFLYHNSDIAHYSFVAAICCPKKRDDKRKPLLEGQAHASDPVAPPPQQTVEAHAPAARGCGGGCRHAHVSHVNGEAPGSSGTTVNTTSAKQPAVPTTVPTDVSQLTVVDMLGDEVSTSPAKAPPAVTSLKASPQMMPEAAHTHASPCHGHACGSQPTTSSTPTPNEPSDTHGTNTKTEVHKTAVGSTESSSASHKNEVLEAVGGVSASAPAPTTSTAHKAPEVLVPVVPEPVVPVPHVHAPAQAHTSAPASTAAPSVPEPTVPEPTETPTEPTTACCSTAAVELAPPPQAAPVEESCMAATGDSQQAAAAESAAGDAAGDDDDGEEAGNDDQPMVSTSSSASAGAAKKKKKNKKKGKK